MDPLIFVALDYSDQKSALKFVEKLTPGQCGLKIGKELFTATGPKFVEYLAGQGYQIFLDLKFHDIPNTVAKACQAAANLGVWMINVHVLGGETMLTAARKALQHLGGQAPKLIGVTILTSHNSTELQPLGLLQPIPDLVRDYALLAQKCGLDGVVCSAHEASMLRNELPQPFMLVTPGIRLDECDQDDQTRIMTPKKAVAAGSDLLVIGRPITRASKPDQILKQIRAELLPPAIVTST